MTIAPALIDKAAVELRNAAKRIKMLDAKTRRS